MQNLFLTPLKIKGKRNLQKMSIAVSDFESLNSKSDIFRCASITYPIFHKKETIETLRNLKKRVISYEIELKTEIFDDLKTYADFLFERFKVVYFYNLSYDSNFIRNYIWKYREDITEREISSGNKILGIQFYDENNKLCLVLKDMFAFCLTSLSTACNEYNCKEKKFPESLSTNEEWTRFFDTSTLNEIHKHNSQDTKMLWELMINVREVCYENFHVDILQKSIYSTASLAMKVYRTNFLKKKIANSFFLMKFEKHAKPEIILRTIHDSETLFDFVKKTYKGGYCNVESTDLFTDLESYDITSSYPNAIQQICYFPTGGAYRTQSLKIFSKKTQKIGGFCKVLVKTNKKLICGNRKGKLIFLSGIFEEYLTSIELNWLIYNGAQILKFYEGYYFREYDKTFSLVNYEWNTFKIKANSIGARKNFAKLLCNALCGKFGQDYRQKSKQYHYYRDLTEYLSHVNDDNVIRTINFDNGGIIITVNESETKKAFMFISWSSLVAAYGRCYLLSQSERCLSKYEDTDSIKIKESEKHLLLNTVESSKYWKQYYKENPEMLLGKWDLEHKLKKFRALAPKTYAMILSDNERDKKYCGKCKNCFDIEGCEIKHVKCKGVPKDVKDKMFYDIISGNTELISEKYLKIMNPNESLYVKKGIIAKTDLFGGIRETQKILHPKQKLIKKLNECT